MASYCQVVTGLVPWTLVSEDTEPREGLGSFGSRSGPDPHTYRPSSYKGGDPQGGVPHGGDLWTLSRLSADKQCLTGLTWLL